MDIGGDRVRSYDGAVLHETRETANGAGRAGLESLTPRELEVLELISGGLTNAEAARRLQVSVHAIKFHLAAIYGRLGVANRTEAAVTYLRLLERDSIPSPSVR
jgi:DNA-binding NarL/FixJ family response regulator